MPRPKGSKNKPMTTTQVGEIVVKRPRGRPRKTINTAVPTIIAKRPRGRPRKDTLDNKVLPNTNLEDFENDSVNLEKIELPEIDEESTSIVETYKPKWSTDDWNGGLENFSISIDRLY